MSETKTYKKGQVYRCIGMSNKKATGNYIDQLVISESGLAKSIYTSSEWNESQQVGKMVQLGNRDHLIADSIEEYEKMEDYQPKIVEKYIEKEIIRKETKVIRKVIHRETYIKQFSNTLFDKLYNWYCSRKGRSFKKTYTEEEIVDGE